MTRTYELGFVVEPRQNDDEVQAIIDRFSGMIEEAGLSVPSLLSEAAASKTHERFFHHPSINIGRFFVAG